jgi:SpoVK/Ycf46/Vps4 family AAA+-type ATPase
MGRRTNNKESIEHVASSSTSSKRDKPIYEQELEDALLDNETCLLVGVPGVGKTYTVNRIAQENKWRVITLLASLRDPTDFMGLPMREGNNTIYTVVHWAREAASSKTPVVLFFDEIDKAPPVVQGACLRIAEEHVVGDDFFLGEETRVVFAANPPEFGGFDLVDPLVNRVARIPWEPSPAEMAQAIMSSTIEIARKRNFSMERANRANRYGGIISTFVTRPGTSLDPPKDRAARQDVWASPRSLTKCAVALSRISDDDKELRNNTIIHRIGVAAGNELIAFIDNLDLPDPEDVLAGRSKIEVDNRSDRVHASLTALVSAVEYNCTIDRWKRCMTVLNEIAENSPDMALPAFRRGIEIAKDPKNNLDQNSWMSVLENSNLGNLSNVLRMAGAIK